MHMAEGNDNSELAGPSSTALSLFPKLRCSQSADITRKRKAAVNPLHFVLASVGQPDVATLTHSPCPHRSAYGSSLMSSSLSQLASFSARPVEKHIAVSRRGILIDRVSYSSIFSINRLPINKITLRGTTAPLYDFAAKHPKKNFNQGYKNFGKN